MEGETTPVRLICRYSNGIVQSHLGRLVSHDGTVLRVACKEQFEPGITLTVASSALPHMMICRIARVARDTANPAWFLLELAPREEARLKASSAPSVVSVSSKPVPEHPERPLMPRGDAPQALVLVRRAAGELADWLERAGPGATVRDAIRAVPSSPEASTWASFAALLLMLERRKIVETAALLHPGKVRAQ